MNDLDVDDMMWSNESDGYFSLIRTSRKLKSNYVFVVVNHNYKVPIRSSSRLMQCAIIPSFQYRVVHFKTGDIKTGTVSFPSREATASHVSQ